MEIKDFNTINLSLEQKKLLKKKIGQGGGSSSDEGIAIFYVINANDGLRFKLIQGKPKVNEWGDLQPIICIDYSPSNYIYLASVLYDFFTFTGFDIYTSTTYTYGANKSYVDDFLALNVGDVLTINQSELTKTVAYKLITLQANKNFPANMSSNLTDLEQLSISYNAGNDIYMRGNVVKIDKANQNLYVSINNELWKYSYTGDFRNPQNITFVEVVQS